MSYDINLIGQAVNIVILDAEPDRTFNKSAIDALGQWQFQPKMVGGKVMQSSEHQVTLAFEID